ncbi:MAG: DinB family protein [Bacteroidia bacterium]
MRDLLVNYAAYNLWANQRIANVLKGLDASVLDKEIPSSFNSIRKTVFHIWDAEFIWLQRLNGLSLSDWPSKQYGADTPIDKFLETSQAFKELVEQLSEADFTGDCVYKNLKGAEYRNPRNEVLQHIFNHSTFHRGQIVTMLRNAGVEEIPATDFIYYTRSK